MQPFKFEMFPTTPPKKQNAVEKKYIICTNKKKLSLTKLVTLRLDVLYHTPSTRRAFSSSHQSMLCSVTERVESVEISDENSLLPELELTHTISCYGKMTADILETLL
jgi:hypothetical protein